MRVERIVAVCSFLFLGCGGRTTGTAPAPVESAAPAPTHAPVAPSASPPPPSPSTTSACTFVNYLDRDSFDVAAAGIQTCIATPTTSTCTRVQTSGEDSLVVADLDEGVGTLRFAYSTEASGMHTMLATRWMSAMAGDVVMKASDIPARFTLEEALTDLYSEDGTPKAFDCSVAR